MIEILSPSTARRDRSKKLDLYHRHGVGKYWIVDCDARCIEVWPLAAHAAAPETHTLRVPVRLGGRLLGEIELVQIFEL